MTDTEGVGGRIAQGRRELGVRLRRDITAADLARAVGVAIPTVYRWESGDVPPSDKSLQRLSDVLGLTPAYLKYGAQPKELADWDAGAWGESTNHKARVDDLVARHPSTVPRESAAEYLKKKRGPKKGRSA